MVTPATGTRKARATKRGMDEYESARAWRRRSAMGRARMGVTSLRGKSDMVERKTVTWTVYNPHSSAMALKWPSLPRLASTSP